MNSAPCLGPPLFTSTVPPWSSTRDLHEVEAEAEAALSPVDPTVGLDERGEQARQERRVDPLAVVRHREDGALALATQRQRDGAAAFRELAGVREQVPHHLREPRAIAVDGQRRVGALELQDDPTRSQEGGVVVRGLARQGGEVDALAAQPDLAVGDARHVEEVVHEARQVLGLARHHLSRAGRLERAGRRPVQDREARCGPRRAGCGARARASRGTRSCAGPPRGAPPRPRRARSCRCRP